MINDVSPPDLEDEFPARVVGGEGVVSSLQRPQQPQQRLQHRAGATEHNDSGAPCSFQQQIVKRGSGTFFRIFRNKYMYFYLKLLWLVLLTF